MRANAKKILQMSSLVIFFLLICFYAFFGAQDLIFGVKIQNVMANDTPLLSGGKFENNIIQIKGAAKNAIKLTLNGREITIDENGNFNETIALLPGYNIINIKAKDKFGYVDEKNYQIIN